MDASLSFSSSADSKFKVLPVVKKVLPIAQVLIPGSGIIGKAAGVAALL